jgi:hypothetical protein
MKLQFIIFISIIFLFPNSIFGKIKKIEIFALPFENLYFSSQTKRDVRKSYDQYVRIISKDKLIAMEKVLDNLQEYNPASKLEDFRAIVIIHYNFFRRDTYCVASGSWGIEKRQLRYMPNDDFMEFIYSFFPKSYYWQTSLSSK